MHTGTIPVALHRLRMKSTATPYFSQVRSECNEPPDLVTALSSALGEDLEFPLSCHHLGIDSFNVQPRLEAQVQVLIHNLATVRITSAHGGVIRALRARETVLRETERQIGVCIDQGVFLLQTKPKIVILILNRGAAVGLMRRAVSIEHLTHNKPAIAAEPVRIGVHGYRF